MPKNGAAWNQLGYARLNQKRNADAITAFRKYVELSPTEPNAHDSLAEALLANGQLDDALAEYEKAIDSSGGKFWSSYNGVATVKAIRGDWDGARAAIAKQKELAPQGIDKLWVQMPVGWTWLAQGKLPDALKALNALEKEAVAAKEQGVVAEAQLRRSYFYLAAGKPADALKALTVAGKAKVDSMSEGAQRGYKASVLAGNLEAYARLGKLADAEKSLTALEETVKGKMTGPMANDLLAFGRGMVAMGKKDHQDAVEAFKGCSEWFDYCRLTLAEAQEKAGDAAAATATRTALLQANHRDAEYWFIRARAEAALKAPGKKVGTLTK